MTKGFVLSLKSADDFRTAYEALKDLCFPGGAQWFGWCETDIRLPRPLSEEAFNTHWDVVRIFSPVAELRRQRRGPKSMVLLLTENEEIVHRVKTLFEIICWEFVAEPAYRILAGKKPSTPIPQNPDALVEVMFPRPLDYGISVKDKEEVLIAEVQCYYDDEHRLRFVRYFRVQVEKEGEREVEAYEIP